MGMLLNNCFEAIRKASLFSALDLPWQMEGPYRLTEQCMFFPVINYEYPFVQQTIARLFFSIFIPHLARPCAIINGAVGVVHLGHAIFLQSSGEVERALIRLAAALYDVALHALLWYSYPYSRWVQGAFYVGFTLFPTLTLQFHRSIFNNVDDELQEGCLIKQVVRSRFW
jgi:hypothetical protein